MADARLDEDHGPGCDGPLNCVCGPVSEQDMAIARLHEWLKPGNTVHTILRHVSSSGMTRWISPIKLGDDRVYDLRYNAALALGVNPSSYNAKHDGIKRGGCGMDMGFDLVYSLSRAMFPEGFECIGEKCPANDHSNGDRDYTPGHVVHRDGGYALKQAWL